MLTLRRFEAMDTELVASRFNLNLDGAKNLINEWNTQIFDGKHFEMFAIISNETVVGMISMYEHSKSVISIGPEIFEEYRRQGFAKSAMEKVISIAQRKQYAIVLQHVRINNEASIKLHESLNFEKDNSIYKNKKGNDIYLYLKCIL